MAISSCPIQEIITDLEQNVEVQIDAYVNDNDTEIVVNEVDMTEDIAALSADIYSDIDSLTETIVKNGHSPYVSDVTNTWWEYDDDLGEYVDTEISPSGAECNVIPVNTIYSIWESCVEEDE